MSVIIRNKKDGLPMGVFMRYTVGRRVLAKVVDGKLLCATRVITNTQEGMDTWREYPSIESAAAQLGVAPPKLRVPDNRQKTSADKMGRI